MLRIDEIPNVEKSHERKEISKDIETPTNELADCIQLQSNEFEKVCVLPSSHSDPQQLNENVAPKEELINSRVRNVLRTILCTIVISVKTNFAIILV